MADPEKILFEGTVGQYYKAVWHLIAGIIFIISVVGEFFLIVWLVTEQTELVFTFLRYVLIGFASFTLVLGFWGLWYHYKDYYPYFTVTPYNLILKETNWRGKVSEKMLKVEQVRTICTNEESPDSNCFWFYTKIVREIISECPSELRREYMELGLPLECFYGWDLEFPRVNKPIQLFRILEGLIPLKQHPNHPTIFERVE